MKWYHWLILVVLFALAFGLGYAWHWYTSPLGCPMCLCTKEARTALEIVQGLATISKDYAWLWGLLFAAVALPTWGLFTWIGYELHRLVNIRPNNCCKN